jgi:hypothetical protein
VPTVGRNSPAKPGIRRSRDTHCRALRSAAARTLRWCRLHRCRKRDQPKTACDVTALSKRLRFDTTSQHGSQGLAYPAACLHKGVMSYDWSTSSPGVFSRHEDGCPVRNGGLCTCRHVRYRATSLQGEADPRTLGPEFDSMVEARAWQQGQDQSHGEGGGLTGFRVTDLIDDFLHAAERGDTDAPWGAEYTQGQLRELRGALSYADAELGADDVRAVSRRRVQTLIDELSDAGLSEARLSSVVAALQALYGYGVSMGIVDHTPIVELALPDPERDRSNHAMPQLRRDGATPEATRQSMPVGEAGEPPGSGLAGGADQMPNDTSASGDFPPGDPAPPGYPTQPFMPPPPDPGPDGFPTQGQNVPTQGQNVPTQDGYPTQGPNGYPTQGPNGYPTQGQSGFPTPAQNAFPNPGVYFPPAGYPTPQPYPTPEGYPMPGGYATPNGYGAQPRYTTPNGYTAYQTPEGFPGASGYSTPGQPSLMPPWGGVGTGAFPTAPGTGAYHAEYDATMQERFMWWTVRIIVIVFVLIALVLAAESV